MPLNIQHIRDGEPQSHRWSLEMAFRCIKTMQNQYGVEVDNLNTEGTVVKYAVTVLDPWNEYEDNVVLLPGDEVHVWRG